jgi:O-succinylbenzoic acid--CoA ligase
MERGELAVRLSGQRTGAPCAGPVVEESDPARFMASFAAAAAGEGNVFLSNPLWRSSERADLARLVSMGPCGETGWLMIPSGGAGGGLKFARHDGRTIRAAVEGFCRHFEMERVNAVSVLPLHHVSGFMAWMRSALTGGSFTPWSWKEAESGRFPPETPADCCLSLVPTQLQRLLSSARAVGWLRRFRIVFVGGGPVWDGLIEEAARLELPISTSYGATETAAMVAAVRPEQFLSGMRGCGRALPHARIDLVDGVVRIEGESVFRGYFPGLQAERAWMTGDIGSLERDGSLVILGRRDDTVVTGGHKVMPSEVEAALMKSGEFEDVAVIGIPDSEWGQLVVACYSGASRTLGAERLREALSGLASFKHPKRYVRVSPWPRNAQGKINRRDLLRFASGG